MTMIACHTDHWAPEHNPDTFFKDCADRDARIALQLALAIAELEIAVAGIEVAPVREPRQ